MLPKYLRPKKIILRRKIRGKIARLKMVFLDHNQYGYQIINQNILMSFYGLTYNYDKDINDLQQKINTLRQQLPKPEPQRNDLHELHHYINIKTIGKTILESILSMQYVGRSISKYVKRQCVAPVEEQIRPVKEVYDQLPDAITEIKDIATEEMSFRQRYVLCGLAAMLVCIRGLGRRKGTVFRPLGVSALTFCGASWLFVPEFNAKWTNLITQQVL